MKPKDRPRIQAQDTHQCQAQAVQCYSTVSQHYDCDPINSYPHPLINNQKEDLK